MKEEKKNKEEEEKKGGEKRGEIRRVLGRKGEETRNERTRKKGGARGWLVGRVRLNVPPSTLQVILRTVLRVN